MKEEKSSPNLWLFLIAVFLVPFWEVLEVVGGHHEEVLWVWAIYQPLIVSTPFSFMWDRPQCLAPPKGGMPLCYKLGPWKGCAEEQSSALSEVTVLQPPLCSAVCAALLQLQQRNGELRMSPHYQVTFRWWAYSQLLRCTPQAWLLLLFSSGCFVFVFCCVVLM